MTVHTPVRFTGYAAAALPLLALLGFVGWAVLLAATAGPATAMFAAAYTCVLACRRVIQAQRPRPVKAGVDDDELIARILEEEASSWPLP